MVVYVCALFRFEVCDTASNSDQLHYLTVHQKFKELVVHNVGVPEII